MGTQLTPKKGHPCPQFLSHVCCGQMVAHLSYCWALVIVFGVLSPEKILHWKVRYLSSWPIKCSHSNLKKKIKKSFFCNKSSWAFTAPTGRVLRAWNCIYFLLLMTLMRNCFSPKNSQHGLVCVPVATKQSNVIGSASHLQCVHPNLSA